MSTKSITFEAFFAFVTFFAFIAPSFASSILMQPATTYILLGEPISIPITATYPTTYQLSLDTAAIQEASFYIHQIQFKPPQTKGDQKEQHGVLTVTPFEVGESTFPSLTWTLIPTPNSQPPTPNSQLLLKSPPIKFQVLAPFLPEEIPSDIRDIKPPFALFPWSWAISVAILFSAILWYLWRHKYKSKLYSSRLQKMTEQLPAHEQALKALESLIASGLWEEGGAKIFYNTLADILRNYLDRRYEIPSLYLTTSDLFRQMRAAEIERSAIQWTKQVLENCDLVKFAKYNPTDADREQDIYRIKKIIETTMSHTNHHSPNHPAYRQAGNHHPI
ncbi:MAG: hypothetical protein HY400_02835 [Elusimicrobia bacterium]|nr:hypothetical protein [Elusimicrobiota bacterium]